MSADLFGLLPGCSAEVILAAGLLVLPFLRRRPMLADKATDFTLVVVAASALGAVIAMDSPWGFAIDRMLVVDPCGGFLKLLVSMTALVTVWVSSRERSQGNWSFFLLSLLGMDLLVGSVHAVSTWLALELVNLSGVLWFASFRSEEASAELAVASLFEGAAGSLLLLLGFALIFGFSGTLEYAALPAKLTVALVAPGGKAVLFLGFALVIAGAGYRIAMAPWGWSRAEVAERGPLAMATWLQTTATIAGVAMLVRLFRGLSEPTMDGSWITLAGVDWPAVVSVAAMATMTLGNLAALRESNLKRLLAWWSIAQSGYLLMGLSATGDLGVQAVVLHTTVYGGMMLGALVVLAPLVEAGGTADLEVLRGTLRRQGRARTLSAALALFLLSLAGVPPLAGYVGKSYLFAVVFTADRWVLASVAALNSLMVLLCCARLIVTMLDRPEGESKAPRLDFDTALLSGALLLQTIGVGLWPEPFVSFLERTTVFFGG